MHEISGVAKRAPVIRSVGKSL